MFDNRKFLSRLTPVLFAFGVTGAALAANQAASTDDPVRCEIKTVQTGGMVSLEGVVHSEAKITGTYRFRVESAAGSGNSSIRQGGAFSAAAGDSVTLGRVMLGSNGIYDAVLELDADGMNVDCEERIGGTL